MPACSQVAAAAFAYSALMLATFRQAAVGTCVRRNIATEWHLLKGGLVKVRSHHEALASIATMLPGLSTLVPFGVALWMRIKRTQVASKPPRKGDV
jgi:hypothetical protein